MRRVLVVALAAVALPGIALAHVVVSPPFVENGARTEIALVVPNERAEHTTIAVRTTAPPGVSIVSAGAPTGWSAALSGTTVTWSGGRMVGGETASFPIWVIATRPAGTAALALTQTYDDGAVVRWKADLSVLPATGTKAPKQRPWGAIVVAAVGVVAIAVGVAVVRRIRRRPLQDR